MEPFAIFGTFAAAIGLITILQQYLRQANEAINRYGGVPAHVRLVAQYLMHFRNIFENIRTAIELRNERAKIREDVQEDRAITQMTDFLIDSEPLVSRVTMEVQRLMQMRPFGHRHKMLQITMYLRWRHGADRQLRGRCTELIERIGVFTGLAASLQQLQAAQAAAAPPQPTVLISSQTMMYHAGQAQKRKARSGREEPEAFMVAPEHLSGFLIPRKQLEGVDLRSLLEKIEIPIAPAVEAPPVIEGDEESTRRPALSAVPSEDTFVN